MNSSNDIHNKWKKIARDLIDVILNLKRSENESLKSFMMSDRNARILLGRVERIRLVLPGLPSKSMIQRFKREISQKTDNDAKPIRELILLRDESYFLKSDRVLEFLDSPEIGSVIRLLWKEYLVDLDKMNIWNSLNEFVKISDAYD